MSSKVHVKGAENDLSNGPVVKRKCTDILFMILFIAHLGVYIAVMVMSYMDGDPERLFAGQDFEGKLCGVTGQATDFGSSLENTNLLYYSMNVTTVVESTVGGLFSNTNTSKFDPN